MCHWVAGVIRCTQSEKTSTEEKNFNFIKVDWGDKGSTEAGSRLAQAKAAIIEDTDEDQTIVPKSSSTPGCWTAAKIKVMAGVAAVSVGYRRVASHRPQSGGNWLYSSNPAV